jgi:hypothetical protein
MSYLLMQGDAGRIPLPDKSVDLVFGSPPYMDARTYGIGAQRGCREWIEWMLGVTAEAVRVSRGLVLWVAAGVTRDWCYWPGVEGLLYRWWEAGGTCWRPAYWHRVGIPGSGGRQWLRADVETVLAFTGEAGPIPWAENTAMGHAPRWGPGGKFSHYTADGTRVHQMIASGERRMAGEVQAYAPPPLSNPGNLVRTLVGGGKLGSDLAHESEAPFPEDLAEFFVRSWCPDGGVVLDPFSGSGTTAAVAETTGRHAIGLDLRRSQCDLGMRRVASGMRPRSKLDPSPAYTPLPGQLSLFDIPP